MTDTTPPNLNCISLSDFAQEKGLVERTCQRMAKAGRIVGARQNPLTKKWWVYPPAQIVKGRHW